MISVFKRNKKTGRNFIVFCYLALGVTLIISATFYLLETFPLSLVHIQRQGTKACALNGEMSCDLLRRAYETGDIGMVITDEHSLPNFLYGLDTMPSSRFLNSKLYIFFQPNQFPVSIPAKLAFLLALTSNSLFFSPCQLRCEVLILFLDQPKKAFRQIIYTYIDFTEVLASMYNGGQEWQG